MPLHHWLIYVSVVLAVIVAPGPTAILCISHGAVHGPVRTAATIVGGMSASVLLMVLSALGLGAAIAASDTLFHAIKYLGAAYLVYLGVSTWRSPAQQFGAAPDAPQPALTTGIGRTLFRKGFIVGIGNPKDLLFFGSLFPQFINTSNALLPQLIVLGATWLAVDGSVMFTYAKCGALISRRLKDSRLGKTFNRITGGAFLAAGGALAVANR